MVEEEGGVFGESTPKRQEICFPKSVILLGKVRMRFCKFVGASDKCIGFWHAFLLEATQPLAFFGICPTPQKRTQVLDFRFKFGTTPTDLRIDGCREG